MTRKLALTLSCLTLISACISKPEIVRDPVSDTICTWGKENFDLCKFDDDEQRIEALLSEMSLKEKIGQMTQSIWHNNVSPKIIRAHTIGSIIHTEGPTPGPKAIDWTKKFNAFQRQALRTRLGIPLLIAVDAVHGQNTFEGAVIFPHNIGMAASRNLGLIKQAAQITAIEAAGTGFNWTFSPCIAMPEHEHWGRVYEGFTEDRDFTTAAALASISGLQGFDLQQSNTIAATAKHYLGDGATQGGVEGGNAVIDDAELRNRHLPPYQAAVDNGIAAVMVGFNSVNDVNMHQHKHLVSDVLKGELGFEGVVVTDWDGGLRFGEPHTVINAGIDIAMQPGNHKEFMDKLSASVSDDIVPMGRIDDAVRRILKLKFSLGLFKRPFAKEEYSQRIGSLEHRRIARQAVRESLVLLKSENSALPLTTLDNLIVVGEHANNSGLQSGGWSIHWQGQTESYRGATTIFEGIKSISPTAEYSKLGCYEGMHADKAIVVVGEQPYAEGAGDTDELWLSEAHKELISTCKSLVDKLVVVLISGRALVINEELDASDAFIAAWLPGSEGGGVADFLFSVEGFKPIGKLPYGWPATVDDLPLTQDAKHALFPYGFGLEDY